MNNMPTVTKKSTDYQCTVFFWLCRGKTVRNRLERYVGAAFLPGI